jgi:hypothetical protein
MDTTKKRKYSVIIVPDKASEKFRMSSCNCDSCNLMHESIKKWETYTPETTLQRNMKKIVAKLEKDIDVRKKKKRVTKKSRNK